MGTFFRATWQSTYGGPKKNFEIEATYSQTLHGGGYQSHIVFLTQEFSAEQAMRIADMSFNNFKSIDLHAKYYFNIIGYRPFLGVGYCYNILGRKRVIEYHTDLILNERLTDVDKIGSIGIKAGIPIGNFEFSFFSQYGSIDDIINTKYSWRKSYQGFSLNYKFNSHTFKQSSNSKSYPFEDLWFRAGVGLSQLIPTDKNGALNKGFIVFLEKEFFNTINLGLSWEVNESTTDGFNKSEFQTFTDNFEGYPAVYGERKLFNLSAVKFYTDGYRYLDDTSLVVYGLGIGYYEQSDQSALGLVLRTGLRTRFTSHNLEVNFPGKGIASYVGFQNLFSLSYHQ